MRTGGGGAQGKNAFELVFACRRYCSWVNILSEVFHGGENQETQSAAKWFRDLMAHTHRYSACMTSPCDGQLFRWKVVDYPNLARIFYLFINFFSLLTSFLLCKTAATVDRRMSNRRRPLLPSSSETHQGQAKEIAICAYPSLRSLRKNASRDRGMCRLAPSVHSHLTSARRLETLLLSSPFVLRLKSRSKSRTKKKKTVQIPGRINAWLNRINIKQTRSVPAALSPRVYGEKDAWWALRLDRR